MTTLSSDLAAQPAGPAGRSRRAPESAAPYGRTFWFAYMANMSLMMAITLLYRYADFITYLEGNEVDLGWIVGIGMSGSLLMRFAQAGWIDRHGSRRLWLGSVLVFACSVLAHVAIHDVHSPWIYVLRVAMSTSVAGAFGASITYVSRSMPVARMAEVIGTLGTSGFVAMLLGPLLGDFLRRSQVAPRDRLNLMFVIAATLAGCSLVCAYFASWGEVRPAPRRRLPMLRVLRRYHPGPVLAVGVMLGIGASLPTVFLPTYAADRHIPHIAAFFVVYACIAFLTRLATRRFPHRFGVRPMIFLGLGAQIVSLLSYLAVHRWWHLALPGFFGGVSHAVLFPSVVAAGSGEFPERHRGLGTVMILAMLDLGTLLGAPIVGELLDRSRMLGLPPYPTMFASVAAGCAAVLLLYATASRNGVGRSARKRLAGSTGGREVGSL